MGRKGCESWGPRQPQLEHPRWYRGCENWGSRPCPFSRVDRLCTSPPVSLFSGHGSESAGLLMGPGLPFRAKICRKQAPWPAAGGMDATHTLGSLSWVSDEPSVRQDAIWAPPQDGHGHTPLDDSDGHHASNRLLFPGPRGLNLLGQQPGSHSPLCFLTHLAEQKTTSICLSSCVHLDPPYPHLLISPWTLGLSSPPSSLSSLTQDARGSPQSNYKIQGSPNHSQLQQLTISPPRTHEDLLYSWLVYFREKNRSQQLRGGPLDSAMGTSLKEPSRCLSPRSPIDSADFSQHWCVMRGRGVGVGRGVVLPPGKLTFALCPGFLLGVGHVSMEHLYD